MDNTSQLRSGAKFRGKKLKHEKTLPFFCLDKGAMKQNPSCLGYMGNYTTELYGDYNKPL